MFINHQSVNKQNKPSGVRKIVFLSTTCQTTTDADMSVCQWMLGASKCLQPHMSFCQSVTYFGGVGRWLHTHIGMRLYACLHASTLWEGIAKKLGRGRWEGRGLGFFGLLSRHLNVESIFWLSWLYLSLTSCYLLFQLIDLLLSSFFVEVFVC